MTEEEVPNTTFLKSVVIILGILILGVASVIGVTIYKRVTKSAETAEPAPMKEIPVPSVVMPMSNYGDVEIAAPDGMNALTVLGGNGLLMVTYGQDANPEIVIVINPTTGKEIGRIKLNK